MRQKQAHTTGRRQLSPSSTTKRKNANYSVRRQSLSSAELGSKVRARSLELETRTVARALSRRRSLNRGTELYEFRIVKSRPASLYQIPERRSGGWRVGPTVSWPGESERHSSVSCRTEVSSTGSRVRPATRTDMSEVREVGRSPSIPERLYADVTADLYHHMAVYHPCHIGLPAACSTRSSGRRDCDLRSSFTLGLGVSCPHRPPVFLPWDHFPQSFFFVSCIVRENWSWRRRNRGGGLLWFQRFGPTSM
ncbi:hypothetical protein MPTK1_6g03250 [Marchantia polymorpha subsp. ruderalis]|uniref:Uncharacterized protein n=2 Tax=Marchantia polymorpha TaxID=3197 RepID=A0AAF6BN28_MARPO|nr:hypothetical protein MARPO_0035s0105 [Marchantia polymorpha]BBN13412.1 hypothetical protein Mp_6g03250 [Marchantia polymorpha subsp. ruderalis]|eukprot:PTQ41333.1 hypothetical protein MARPO_0035s0105 [Marchantia polymorpha]